MASRLALRVRPKPAAVPASKREARARPRPAAPARRSPALPKETNRTVRRSRRRQNRRPRPLPARRLAARPPSRDPRPLHLPSLIGVLTILRRSSPRKAVQTTVERDGAPLPHSLTRMAGRCTSGMRYLPPDRAASISDPTPLHGLSKGPQANPESRDSRTQAAKCSLSRAGADVDWRVQAAPAVTNRRVARRSTGGCHPAGNRAPGRSSPGW